MTAPRYYDLPWWFPFAICLALVIGAPVGALIFLALLRVFVTVAWIIVGG